MPLCVYGLGHWPPQGVGGGHRCPQSVVEAIVCGLIPPAEETGHSAKPNAPFLWGERRRPPPAGGGELEPCPREHALRSRVRALRSTERAPRSLEAGKGKQERGRGYRTERESNTARPPGGGGDWGRGTGVVVSGCGLRDT
jgi:hypothetical protein